MPAPVTLAGRHVRLEPLSQGHVTALAEVGLDPSLWTFVPTKVRTAADMARYVAAALAEQAAGRAVPFATVEAATGRVIGSTRFGNLAPEHRRAEIGWTWVAPAWQRTAANTEAKLLMLTHAFATWGCLRVELKTSARNTRSRAAILRLGALEEGTLRSHMVEDDGTVRDTVYFSILQAEWPGVRARLEARLAAGGAGEAR